MTRATDAVRADIWHESPSCNRSYPAPQVGERCIVAIYGRLTPVTVLAVYPFGTFDVERGSDGQCFRVTGGNWIKGETVA